jgi:RNA polymerase sigma-70 factor (ECF subfamily)
VEADLLERVRIGDCDAYGILVRRYSPIALRTAILLGAGADAEDVVQEAFVRAYRAIGGFRPGSAFRPWLLTIVGNETRNLHRGRARRAERERHPIVATRTDGVSDPADDAISRERSAVLHRELDRLPPRNREVLVCRFLLELTELETAEVLGLAPGTVKSRSARGLRRLREQLGNGRADRDDGLGRPDSTTAEARHGD